PAPPEEAATDPVAPEAEAPEAVEPPAEEPPAEPSAEPQPAETLAESSGGETSELWGFSAHPEKVVLALVSIREVCEENRSRPLDEFVSSFMQKMGWQNLRRKQVGGIFTALVRRALIQKVSRGSQPVAYALTDEGRRQLEDDLPRV